MSRICSEVQAHLPGYVARTLPRARRRLVGLHLRRCADCQADFARQRAASSATGPSSATGQPVAPGSPPVGLLDSLLDQAAHPGVKGRVAVPARGAVSGARPALSAALLVAGAAAGTAMGYAGWRGVRTVRGRFTP